MGQAVSEREERRTTRRVWLGRARAARPSTKLGRAGGAGRGREAELEAGHADGVSRPHGGNEAAGAGTGPTGQIGREGRKVFSFSFLISTQILNANSNHFEM